MVSSTTWLVSLGLAGLGLVIWGFIWWGRRPRRPAPSRLPRQGALDELIDHKRKKGL